MISGTNLPARSTASIWMTGVAAVMLAATSAAQIAPPPSAQPAPAKAEMPPAPPPPRAIEAPENKQPGARPTAARNVPNIAYVSLVTRDEAGQVIPIEGLPEFAAFKHNPVVLADHIDTMKPIVIEWVDRLDSLVLDNADIVLDIDGGLFTNMDLEDQGAVWVANQVIMSMVSTGKLSNHLVKRGVMMKEMGDFNQKIVSEYVQAVSQDLAKRSQEAHADNRQAQFNDMARSTLNQLASDALWSLNRLVDAAGSDMRKALAGTSLSGAERSRIERAVAAAPDKAAALKSEMRAMNYEDVKAILEAGRAIRPFDANIMDAAKVKPEGTGEAPSHYQNWRAQ